MPANEADAPPSTGRGDVTLRQVVHLTIGGQRLRVRLSNAFGTEPLSIDAVHVALADPNEPGAIRPGSDHVLGFSGSTQVVVPSGADWLSDPLVWTMSDAADLVVTMHLTTHPSRWTVHPVALSDGYLAPGDQAAARVLHDAVETTHRYQLSEVEVDAGHPNGVAVLGDSITDGHGSTPNANNRWPDILADRLRVAGDPRAVTNLGISGNRLLKDGSGPNGLARFDRDVLGRPGFSTLIVLEGVNDLGSLSREGPVTPERRAAVVRGLIAAYAQIVERGHAHGLRVVGATLLPFGGTRYYRSDADADADRRAVNDWIRTSGRFDAVIDFDAVVRDPVHPDRLRPDFDSGDRLHPSPAGYRAMGDAIPLEVLR